MERSSYLAPLLALALVATCVHPSSVGAQDERDPVRSALAKHIDEAKQGTGGVVGLLTPEGRSFMAHGRVSVDGELPTADTVFEIGSVTKIFTAFLLADMVERGEVALNDPVRKYLPPSVIVPSRRGKEISLVDLATHTSGLPRDSVEVDLNSGTSPYTGYAASDLYAFLESYKLGRDPGSQVEYSNVGVGLLGHALALRAGVSYEDLLRRRLFDPLGMTNTTITPGADQRSRRATGYDVKLLPVTPWTGGVVAPAGGVTSTAADMLKFAAAVVDPKSPLKTVFARMKSVKRPIEGSRDQQGLGWGMFRFGANEILAHDGGTFGFQTRFIVDTTRKRAVIVWINGAAPSPSPIL